MVDPALGDVLRALVAWCLLLIPAYPTMRVVYLSYTVSFFLMLALLLPKYRRMMAAGEERK